MKHKCFNFKIAILTSLLTIGFAMSLCSLIYFRTFIQMFVVGLLFGALCLCFLIFLLINEPLYYCIDDNGIEIHSFFRKKLYTWQSVVSIKLVYDDIFNYLFIKDYVIFHTKGGKHVRRMERIAKSKKTTVLINKYYRKVIG